MSEIASLAASLRAVFVTMCLFTVTRSRTGSESTYSHYPAPKAWADSHN
jgi:hypothetical protein